VTARLEPCIPSSKASPSAPGRFFGDQCLSYSADESYKGGCDDITEWDLYYSDASTQGSTYVDSAFEEVGCTGGHKVCSDGCAFIAQQPVQPNAPVPVVGFYDSSDGYLSWDEYSMSTTQGAFCDDPADTCWNDINTQSYMGESIEQDWTCVVQ